MNPELQALIEIQNIDSQISSLEQKMAQIPKNIKKFQEEMTIYRLEYEEKVRIIEDIEKGKRKKERELDVKENSLAKLKDQLLSVKTNREYQTLLHEIDGVKESISQLEEELIFLIEENESSKALIKRSNNELKEKEQFIDEQKKNKERELEELHQQSKNLELRKASWQQQVSQELLEAYKKIRQYRNGVAVVSVKDGSCQGCFMNLMPQLFQEVKQNTKIYKCPHCQRIIYFKEE